jgi:hypothetical protein
MPFRETDSQWSRHKEPIINEKEYYTTCAHWILTRKDLAAFEKLYPIVSRITGLIVTILEGAFPENVSGWRHAQSAFRSDKRPDV